MTYTRLRTARRAVLTCVAVAVGGACLPALKAAEPQTQPGPTTRVESARPGRFKIHVRGADIRGLLQQLSLQSSQNIVATQDVRGEVTADLFDVTFEEALDAIARGSGFAYTRKEKYILVCSPEYLAKLEEAQRKLVVATIPLSYVKAEDVEKLIAPLMSSVGKLSVSPAAAAGVAADEASAGANSYATNDVIVIRDYEDVIREVRAVIAKLDVRPPQVLIEAAILKATLTENNDLGIDFSVLGGVDLRNISTSANLSSTGFSSKVSADTGLNINLTADSVNFVIRALEGITDLTVLAKPNLLVVNKQRGQVMIGARRGYRTTTITETTATETVEFLETGIQLVVRPFVCEGGYIRIEIHPEDSDGSVQGGLPTEETTEVTTNVMVRDGHTIILGGLFREENQAGRNQIPVLGNIPYVGALFRHTADQVERQEVIMLITPRIVPQDVVEAVSKNLEEDGERFRVGQRKGLRWWGRGQLAEQRIRLARKALRQGRRDRALWHVDMALSMNPRLLEAIRLKEELTQQVYGADHPKYSAVKDVVQRLMLEEMGLKPGPFIPPPQPAEPPEPGPEAQRRPDDATEPSPRPDMSTGNDDV